MYWLVRSPRDLVEFRESNFKENKKYQLNTLYYFFFKYLNIMRFKQVFMCGLCSMRNYQFELCILVRVEKPQNGCYRKRIANGCQKDSRRTNLALFFSPFAILLLSVCYPAALSRPSAIRSTGFSTHGKFEEEALWF